jgi:hypothetical protein
VLGVRNDVVQTNADVYEKAERARIELASFMFAVMK